jgi:cytochrome c peroxidase
MTLTADLMPASPTNAHANDPAAVGLGRQLFFDKRMSSDGTVGCVNCHDPAHGFSDPHAFSTGVRGQLGGRHAMPVFSAAFHPFTLWDGRSDSLWSQPLKALENPKEMDFTRLDVAAFIGASYRTEYEDVFGPLPTLDGLPARGRPGDPAWDGLSHERQDDVLRVFTNVGKAIEAYERQLICAGTRFDQWSAGAISLSDQELSGARVFDREHCARCHAGPSFSDGGFHNLGVDSPDQGRALGIPQLLSDPFNGVGAYSDDPTSGAARLATISSETNLVGAFRTPSLRGVGQRTFFGHIGQHQNLDDFVRATYTRRRRDATVGTVDPLLDDVHVDGDEVDDVVAFLHTLDCPTPAAGLLAP